MNCQVPQAFWVGVARNTRQNEQYVAKVISDQVTGPKLVTVNGPVFHDSVEIEARNAIRMKHEKLRKNIDFSDSCAARIASIPAENASIEKEMNDSLS